MLKYTSGKGSVVVGLGLALLLFVGLISRAAASQNWKDHLEAASQTSAEVELFSIAGSNTVGEQLAPAMVVGFLRDQGFSDVTVEPTGEHHGKKVLARWNSGERPIVVSVPVEAKGSSTGFKALLSGTADLAASSRPIKDKELSQLANVGDMNSLDCEHIVAIDGLAIIVHRTNPVTKLPLQAIRDIFTGKITNWSQVGGRAGAIQLHARDDRSGTYDTFNRLVLAKQKLSSKAKRYEGNDDLSMAVQSDANAIGFVALSSVGDARALSVSDGVAQPLTPTELTVGTEDYPLARRLYLYSGDANHRKPVVSAFLQYAHSNAGQSFASRAGYVAQALYSLPLESNDGRLAGLQRMNLNIRFEDGTSSLDNKSLMDVQRLTDFLSQVENSGRRVTLVGFSNPVEGASQSTVSRLRAQNVRWALRNQGIRNKVSAIAGNAVNVSDPSSLNAERNRRVEVWIQ